MISVALLSLRIFVTAIDLPLLPRCVALLLLLTVLDNGLVISPLLAINISYKQRTNSNCDGCHVVAPSRAAIGDTLLSVYSHEH